MDDFGREVVGRLAAMERSQGWLARRVRRSPSAISHYLKGRRPWPVNVKLMVIAILDIHEERAA